MLDWKRDVLLTYLKITGSWLANSHTQSQEYGLIFKFIVHHLPFKFHRTYLSEIENKQNRFYF